MGQVPELEPICYINGRRYVLPPGRGETTLLQFLRESGLTGTKLGCGEGGCGACTVMLSHWEDGSITHRSVNACLCPLYAVEGMHVVTVEGIGNVREGLHPVQAQLARSHGSQCGFCTPGFVMSMYALLRSSTTPPTQDDIEDALGGNLCRCTGYRPILDAFKVFAKTDPSAYTEEAIAAAKGLGLNGHAATTASGLTNGIGNQDVAICPSTGQPCDCSKSKPNSDAKANGASTDGKASGANSGCGAPNCCMNGGQGSKAVQAVTSPSEPIFPPELKGRTTVSLSIPGAHVHWYRPTTLAECLSLKAKHPTAKIVVGNTEVGIEMKFKDAKYPVIIAPTHVPELNTLRVTEAGVEVGSAVTLTKMMTFLKDQIGCRPAHETSAFKAVVNQLRWFAGNQIRNVSAVGGNIVTGSPISDLNPIWMASGTLFTVLGEGTGERTVKASEFFLGYRQVDLQPHEILYKILVPFTRPFEYVKEFKQSPRREDDIAIVNAGMRVKLGQDAAGAWVVEEAAIAYGGVAPKAIMAPAVAASLLGKELNEASLEAALAAVDQDVHIAPTAPGGRVEYRRALAASFLFKLFVHVQQQLENDSKGTPFAYNSQLPPSSVSAAAPYQRPHAHGVQFCAEGAVDEVVGQPVQHMAADLQVSGEATYTDDIKLPADALHAAFVTSTRPHAKLLKVDPTAALQLPGVEGYFGAKDVPGDNHIGPVWHDEEVFATEEVTCVGQVIGVVVATTEAIARRAAKLVVVEYEDLPAVMSCEEAIAANSFYSYSPSITCGDVDAALASECDHVIEGVYKVGGQEHFYLEPQNCLVIPEENHEFVLVSSTQAPSKHQRYVAGVLGVPAHKVVSKTKRLGGGFGGKETRGIFMHCAIAVPAYKLRRAVRVCLDRDEDMQMTGQRHAFMAKYKVGFTKEGRVVALDAKLYHNTGNSMDLSHSIMERALLHSDCAYKIPHVRVTGHLCKTHQASNTAFRGFGGPQGMMFAEMWVEQIAKAVGKPDHEVRQLNMYTEGQTTHFGQVLEHCRARPCWDQALSNADFQARLQAVQEYNAQNRWRKRGLSATPTKFGISFTTKFLNQAGALVHIYLDGTVLVTHGGVEMGQGLHTKMAQVAAQTLRIPLSKVFISETSTDKVPNASPTAASASSDMYGGAILDACSQLRSRLEPYFEKLGADASWEQVVDAAYKDRVDLSAHGFYITPDITGFGGDRPFNYFCYGAAVTEVELDTLTGDWQILRTDIVMDVGNPINPAIDIGQVEGGFVQGMGWLCLEELIWGDQEHAWVRPGQLFTRGPGTYKIPTANDIPVDFRVTLLQNAPNVRAVHSSKAVGEPPFHLGASAFFALKDAVYAARKDAGHERYFVLDAPATPERLRMLCADNIAARYVAPDFRAKISC